MANTDEKVINSHLAELFCNMRMTAHAELSSVFSKSNSLKPDISVSTPSGEPVILETEKHPASTVEKDAISRLGLTIKKTGKQVEQVIAVKFPKTLSKSQNNLVENLKSCDLSWCLFSTTPDKKSHTRWPEAGWITGKITDLGRLVQSISLSEIRITEGSDILEQDTCQTAEILQNALQKHPDIEKGIAEYLYQEEGLNTIRMAVAIISNAFVFQITLAGNHNIKDPSSLRNSITQKIHKIDLIEAWRKILEINYYPIFDIAINLLKQIPTRPAVPIIEKISETAEKLENLGVTRLPDLSGRMFQRLISDRQFLATYYTMPSSATLLAELVLSKMEIDWADPESIKSLKIGDFACGTGTLLNAVYTGIRSRHQISGKDSSKIHKSMMEKSLIATDIMPVAAHLTSTNLSSAHPSIIYGKTQDAEGETGPLSQISVLPYGLTKTSFALGSLDLLDEKYAISLFGSGRTTLYGDSAQKGDSTQSLPDKFPIENGTLDIVIMNPPFTRPTNHEKTSKSVPSFAAFQISDANQKEMSKKLKKITANKKVCEASHGNAGLGSNFADLANLKLKPGGILGLILPAASAQGGKSWDRFQNMLQKNYQGIQIISLVNSDQYCCSFSSDTGMSEVLIVAQKRSSKDSSPSSDENREALFFNLYERPDSLVKAIEFSRQINQIPASDLLKTGSVPIGNRMKSDINHTMHAGIKNPEIISFIKSFCSGTITLPRNSTQYPIPVCNFSDIGSCGLLSRDISGRDSSPFDIIESSSVAAQGTHSWPALWSHDYKAETSFIVRPDRFGMIRHGCTQADASKTWKKSASRLHLTLLFRLNSQSLTACITEQKAIGGRSWPSFFCNNNNLEQLVCLWCNTTIGIILFWANSTRQQIGRAQQTISRIPAMQVPNFEKIARNSNFLLFGQADKIFKKFKDHEFLPANEAYRDPIRKQLDKAIFMDLLGFDQEFMTSLEIIRRQFCEEPSVHGGKSTRPDE